MNAPPTSVPMKIPECVRKPEAKPGKPTNIRIRAKPTKHKKKTVKKQPEMSRDEMLEYFRGLVQDPNFNLLPMPRFVQESDPELFAGEKPENFKEKMRRLDFLHAMDNAKTDEEREAIKAKRAEELKNQVVPIYQRLPVPENVNPYKA